MSKDLAIKVDGLGKLYQLGQFSTGTISHDLKRWWALRQGKEDPYIKIGSENDRTKVSDSDYTWAIRDINFEVKKGEVLGIIGNNGAGKSTLLKILSRVTSPTEGTIKIKGRIASLLEVGTGFHPEMTGRENIFMNGAILGMTKKEIRKHFDDIVEFAGIAKYVETPVKRYSSGMYVRLAFAVAAHLESEILIVDEVLAVGDFDFQKKCLNKMNNIAKNEGRTVLFVSHNLAAVQALCSHAISLRYGKMKMTGNVNDVINNYIQNDSVNASLVWKINPNDILKKKNAYITKILLKSNFEDQIRMGDDVDLEVSVFLKEKIKHLQIGFAIFNSDQTRIAEHYNTDFNTNLDFEIGENTTSIKIIKPNLLPGSYYITVSAVYNYSQEIYDIVNFSIKFIVIVNDVLGSGVPLLSNRGQVWFNARYENIAG